MSEYPFIKFLDPYEKGDEKIYFGRSVEVEQLYSKVKKTSLFVLYGLSGTGKTSILRCGLANKFDESDWFEIFIRRGSDRTIMDAIFQEILKLDPGSRQYASPASLINSLANIYRTNYCHLCLIFDQFEELFINGSHEEKQSFVEFLIGITTAPEKFATIILVMREEYLANLNDFKLSIKTIFNDSIRLERMSRETLGEQVIKNILSKAGMTFDENIIKNILENVTDPSSNNIDLPYVQVYLKALFENISNNGANGSGSEKMTLTEQLLPPRASIEDLLGSFLDNEIYNIANDGQTDFNVDDIWMMLKVLITPEGTKRSLSLESITSEYQ